MTRPALLALCAATALLVAGCGSGGSGESPGGTSPSAAAPAGTGTVNPSEMSDAQAPPDQLVVDVTIKDGAVTPTNEALQAALGEPIVLRVDSDAVDELHVHSTPEHTFDVGVGPAQTFQFTVEVPGRVDVELHDAGATIATIQVQ